ncbi:MAG: hypothetical protein NTV34_18550 [Proteobacteria bacterium]|nr:hypothetical protein [Pseudomonadota bacterium]
MMYLLQAVKGFLSAAVWAFAFMMSSGCDSKRSEGFVTNPTVRNGESLKNIDVKFIDNHPSISGDGTKLVYISGKDDTVLRVRKTSRVAGSAFSSSSRLTLNSGLVLENYVLLSNNGSFVLIQGYTGTNKALVFCDWAGVSCSVLTTEPWGDASFGFSPDSNALFYLKGSASSGATLLVAPTSSPATTAQVGTAGQWQQAFWIPVASGFRLGAFDRSTTVAASNVKTFSFSTVAESSAAASSTVIADLPFNASLDQAPLGGLSGTSPATVLLARKKIKPNSTSVVREFGNVIYSADNIERDIPLSNQAYLYSLGTATSSAVATTGIEMLSGYLASDGNTVFSLNTVGGRCDKEDALTYGRLLAATDNASGKSSWKYLKKPADLSQPPVLADGFCDRVVGGVGTASDFSVSYFVVNAAASASTYTLAWVSDMTSDPEVFAMDVTASGSTLWNVSQNKK